MTHTIHSVNPGYDEFYWTLATKTNSETSSFVFNLVVVYLIDNIVVKLI